MAMVSGRRSLWDGGNEPPQPGASEIRDNKLLILDARVFRADKIIFKADFFT
jgi:hypothetical protein